MINSKTFSDVTNGAVSGSLTTFITQPLQVIRTSMMVTYKEGKVSSMQHIFRLILDSEGVKGFYRGFAPSLLKTATGSAIYFGVLELAKDFIHRNHLDSKKNKLNKNFINFFSAGFARTIQSTIVNPILIVKTRFEVVGSNAYSSILDALIKIKKEEGWSGYFKGLKQTLWKDVPFSAMFYSIYEFSKYMYSYYVTNLQIRAMMSSLTANIILILITNPLDVLRARVQYFHLSKNSHHEYGGIVSGILKITREEGLRGLLVGVIPRFMKKAIGSCIVWSSYETLQLRSKNKRELV
jgi:hypothetical protein